MLRKKIEEHETIIFGGDYNIIPSSEDAIDINKWKNDALHHPESIKLYREIVNQGLSDILRVFNQNRMNLHTGIIQGVHGKKITALELTTS